MRASDEEHYTEYVTARLPALRRIAYLLCGDNHRADDIVQNAITRLYVHWRKARAADNLDAYVRTIVVRTFLNEQRTGWFSRTRVVDEMPEASQSGPDVETSQVLHAALRRVPPKQRAVLVLRFLYDMSVAEVAGALHCSAGNVKSQTSHGLAALRKQLGDHTLNLLGGR
ncbi:SigE family RNA polymerase sigma factor [Kibdelosporangium phytohabitans]|uniref:RNA polymerase subunit sigma-24 n=1 Tax=Kibdelosporangium phytohabitans TaxID=860235 RepID=A0A0N9HV52_9PSEU|nr:SigE family RNA polymerase sigma factor [Kibdelosporangium phytohabitans]ALG06054.1 RNA polymerase subunit sigma-24 [Kibdelosporangium phytohabitans]MBE1465867.1 RNA polymerase sigma-70 factor (sigma-E family) [Kibdelosporangium phytohabitans]